MSKEGVEGGREWEEGRGRTRHTHLDDNRAIIARDAPVERAVALGQRAREVLVAAVVREELLDVVAGRQVDVAGAVQGIELSIHHDNHAWMHITKGWYSLEGDQVRGLQGEGAVSNAVIHTKILHTQSVALTWLSTGAYAAAKTMSELRSSPVM